MVKLYQNIDMDGVQVQNENRKDSQFWNEGKFNNFVKPHLPENATDMTFVEMGSNAGMFLKMAIDHGFKNAVGFEKDKTPVRIGNQYRDEIGYNYKLFKHTLGGQFGDPGTFNIDKVPVSDVTLMSTFHYYIDINSWLKYIHRLKYKTKRVVIISRTVRFRHWKALSDIGSVRKYFKNWKENKYVPQLSEEIKKVDSSPRNIWSISFNSPLERIAIEDIKTESEDDSMYIAIQKLAEEINQGDIKDIQDTDYYKAWIKRKQGRWPIKFTNNFVTNKYNMMMSIKDNGLMDPLIVGKNNKLYDGGHRLAVMKAFGYKSVIVQWV